MLTEANGQLALRQFRPGVYRHYKGQRYWASHVARDCDTGELYVVYHRLYDRDGIPNSVRKLEVWNEYVDELSGERANPMATGAVQRFSFWEAYDQACVDDAAKREPLNPVLPPTRRYVLGPAYQARRFAAAQGWPTSSVHVIYGRDQLKGLRNTEVWAIEGWDHGKTPEEVDDWIQLLAVMGVTLHTAEL